MDLLMYFYEFEIQTDGNDIESRSNEQQMNGLENTESGLRQPNLTWPQAQPSLTFGGILLMH